MNITNEKLLVFFNLALQIGNVFCDYNPEAQQIHVYNFNPDSNGEGVYDVNIMGYYGDWCPDEHPESIMSAIDKAKEYLNSKHKQNGNQN